MMENNKTLVYSGACKNRSVPGSRTLVWDENEDMNKTLTPAPKAVTQEDEESDAGFAATLVYTGDLI